MDHFCYLCFVLVLFSCLFTAALWSSVGKEVTLYMMYNCVFVTFPCSVLDRVWCLIVSIPDLCLRSYFYSGFTYITIIMVFIWNERSE